MKRQWIIRIISLFLMGITTVSSASDGISLARAKDIEPNQGDSSHNHLELVWNHSNQTPDEYICGNILLKIEANYPEQISYVKFIYYGPEVDGPVKIVTIYSPPYQVVFNTCDRVPGWYQIYAIVYGPNDVEIASTKLLLLIPFMSYLPMLMGSG
jgi:hypothetical protein